MAYNIDFVGLSTFISGNKIQRVPGLCFFYTHINHGAPPIFGHYVGNIGSLHEVIVLTTIRYAPAKTILPHEQFLVEGSGYTGVYGCIAKYGYSESLSVGGEEFVHQVIYSMETYIEFSAVEQEDKLINLSYFPLEDCISYFPSVTSQMRKSLGSSCIGKSKVPYENKELDDSIGFYWEAYIDFYKQIVEILWLF